MSSRTESDELNRERAITTVLAVWLAVVMAGALYQLAVGVELLSIGSSPGDGPPLESLFFTLPIILLVPGGFVVWFAATIRPVARALTRSRTFGAVPLAAALFPLCRAVAFDPYFAPGLRRYWDVNTSGGWLALLMALAILLATVAARRPGSWLVAQLTGVVMIASGLTAAFEGLH